MKISGLLTRVAGRTASVILKPWGRYLLVGIAGVIVSLSALLGLQTHRLAKAHEQIGAQASAMRQLLADIREAGRVNDTQVDQIRRLGIEIQAIVSERQAQAEALDAANRRAEARIAAAQLEAQRSATELDAILDGSCEAWARRPVCPDVARWLREHGRADRDHQN